MLKVYYNIYSVYCGTGLTQDCCHEKDDAFKKEFKRFRRPSPEDMKQVIDFNQPEQFKAEV